MDYDKNKEKEKEITRIVNELIKERWSPSRSESGIGGCWGNGAMDYDKNKEKEKEITRIVNELIKERWESNPSWLIPKKKRKWYRRIMRRRNGNLG